MTSASMLREKVCATFYSKDNVTNQKYIANVFALQIIHSSKLNKMNMSHPSFSDFTYHFPERIPNIIAPI